MREHRAQPSFSGPLTSLLVVHGCTVWSPGDVRLRTAFSLHVIRIIRLFCSKSICFNKELAAKWSESDSLRSDCTAVSCRVLFFVIFHVCAVKYPDQFVYLCVALAQRPDVAVQAAPTRQLPQKVCPAMAVSHLFLATVQVLIGTPPALTHLGVIWRSCLCSNDVTSRNTARELLVLPSEKSPCSSTCESCNASERQ